MSMGYVSWHNYGYGVCVSDIGPVSVECIERLLNCAPQFRASVKEWLTDCDIENPTYDDYMEYDQDFRLGLATFLSEVIKEAENIRFTACDDGSDYKLFLIYQPSYPWDLPEMEKDLTENKVQEILDKYIRMLTEEKIAVNYQEVENGG